MLRLAIVGGWQSCSAKKLDFSSGWSPNLTCFLGKIIFKSMFVYFKQLKISFVFDNWLRFKWSRSRVAPEFLSLREPGSGCSKVVEHMPLEQKLVGSNPAGCLAFFFFFFFLSFPFLSHLQQNQLSFLYQVPQEGASLLMMRWTQKIVLAVLLGAKQAKYLHRMEFKKASHREPLKYWTEREGQVWYHN